MNTCDKDYSCSPESLWIYALFVLTDKGNWRQNQGGQRSTGEQGELYLHYIDKGIICHVSVT